MLHLIRPALAILSLAAAAICVVGTFKPRSHAGLGAFAVTILLQLDLTTGGWGFRIANVFAAVLLVMAAVFVLPYHGS